MPGLSSESFEMMTTCFAKNNIKNALYDHHVSTNMVLQVVWEYTEQRNNMQTAYEMYFRPY